MTDEKRKNLLKERYKLYDELAGRAEDRHDLDAFNLFLTKREETKREFKELFPGEKIYD